MFLPLNSNQALAMEYEELDAQISVSPKFCITSESDPFCEQTVTLQWTNSQLKAICIITDHPDLTKWCSQSPQSSSITLNIKTDKDIQFVMIDKDTNKTLAGVKLKVTHTSEPKVRRRYRNPWSLF